MSPRRISGHFALHSQPFELAGHSWAEVAALAPLGIAWRAADVGTDIVIAQEGAYWTCPGSNRARQPPETKAARTPSELFVDAPPIARRPAGRRASVAASPAISDRSVF